VNPKASDLLIVKLRRALREQKLFSITDSVQREFVRRGTAIQA